jgi:thiol-disulfide isomerase/thioredoxin
MSGSNGVVVTFYTKPGCHLCEDVADQLEALSDRWRVAIDAVDITQNLDLHRRFWDKIPVVIVGERTLHAPIDPAALRQVIAHVAEVR